MNSQPTKTDTAPATLRIDGELTIFRAAELKHVLLAEPQPAAIDLSGVTEIDTAGLQLLLLARTTALAERRTLRLLAPSAAVREVFELLKLAGHFDEPPAGTPPAATAAPSASRPIAASH